MKDAAFFVITLGILVFTVFGSRWCSLTAYSRLLLLSILLSILLIIGFNEYEIEIIGNSPLHAGLMALCQYGALTLAAKIWFSINYQAFSSRLKAFVGFLVHGSLLGLIVGSYMLEQSYPLLPILFYPVASISLALIAEVIEERLHR